jgi:hypothetical protein
MQIRGMTFTSQVGANEWSSIKQLVDHTHAKFDGRPVRDFVPLFVERGAKEELTRLSV